MDTDKVWDTNKMSFTSQLFENETLNLVSAMMLSFCVLAILISLLREKI